MTIVEDVKRNFDTDNFYDLFGIPIGSSQNDIKKAYLQLSLKYHPDKTCDTGKKDEYKKKFQILSEVYRILSDDSSRDDYDYQVKHSFGKINEHIICDEVTLRDCEKESDCYYYVCRCSGKFILSMDSINHSDEQGIFVISCDSCSNSVKVII